MTMFVNITISSDSIIPCPISRYTTHVPSFISADGPLRPVINVTGYHIFIDENEILLVVIPLLRYEVN